MITLTLAIAWMALLFFYADPIPSRLGLSHFIALAALPSSPLSGSR